MGRRGYPAEFRRRVLDLVEAGRRVAEVAQDLGITEQTIYNWRRPPPEEPAPSSFVGRAASGSRHYSQPMPSPSRSRS